MVIFPRYNGRELCDIIFLQKGGGRMAANEYDSVAFFQEYAKMKRSRRKK